MPKRSSTKKAAKRKKAVRKKRPTDLNQLAKSLVDDATGNAPDDADSGKNPAAVALGRLGGKKGGPARAKKLSKKRRSQIAKRAAQARWAKPTGRDV